MNERTKRDVKCEAVTPDGDGPERLLNNVYHRISGISYTIEQLNVKSSNVVERLVSRGISESDETNAVSGGAGKLVQLMLG